MRMRRRKIRNGNGIGIRTTPLSWFGLGQGNVVFLIILLASQRCALEARDLVGSAAISTKH